MSKRLGKWLVYWDRGNVHHYFDTFEEAEKYCISGQQNTANIAYVVAVTPPLKMDKVSSGLLEYIGKVDT
jgi:hypothetical protein